MHQIQNLYTHAYSYLKAHKIASSLAGGLVLGFMVGLSVFGDSAEALPVGDSAPYVRVASIFEMNNGSPTLSFVGVVEATSEASVRTQSAGQVGSVNFKLGERVSSGAVIATIENASESATLAQARANLISVEASLDRQDSDALQNAWEAYIGAYWDGYDAIISDTEIFFERDQSAIPLFLLPEIADNKIEKDRATITNLLKTWQKRTLAKPSPETMLSYLTEAHDDLAFMQAFVSRIGSHVNRQKVGESITAEELAIERAAALSAGNGIQGAQVSVSSALDTLKSNTLSSTVGSGEAKAALARAEANLASSRAAYEKTVIRAPIAGLLSVLNLDEGDFIAQGVLAVNIVNPGALEAVIYITKDDLAQVSVGTKALINGIHGGVVTEVAPGINPETKKIEVRIGIESTAELVSGESVTVELIVEKIHSHETGTPLTLPLTALKLTAQGAYVFTVENDVLVAHEVTLGRTQGSSVVIESGLDASMKIVVDARGLKAGERVLITP